MINHQGRRRQLPSVLYAPSQCLQMGVNRACCAIARVEVGRAEANYGAEALFPFETRKLQREIWVGNKVPGAGTGSDFILIDHELADKAHTVVPKMPARRVVIGGSSERSASKPKQVAASAQEFVYFWPRVFGKGGAVGQDQQLGAG